MGACGWDLRLADPRGCARRPAIPFEIKKFG